MKRCSKCGEEKGEECFPEGKLVCRECRAKQKAAWYEANREQIAARRAAHYEANRNRVLAQNAAYNEANRDRVAAQKAAHRKANRERLKKKDAAYYESNRARIAARGAAYYEANRERIAARDAVYREANRERKAARDAAYRKSKPDKRTACRRSRRARKLGHAIKSEGPRWQVVGPRDGWRCHLCGKLIPKRYREGAAYDSRDRMAPTVDHIVPLAEGGPDTYANVRLAHRSCNSSKGAKRVVCQLPLIAKLDAGAPK